jgi:hypothetical protein
MRLGKLACYLVITAVLVSLPYSAVKGQTAPYQNTSANLFVGNVAAPDQNGCVYFTVIAESGALMQPDQPNRYALYHLPENYPHSGAVVITGIEGDPFPLVNGVPGSYFQFPQCQSPAIYVLDIASNGALSLSTPATFVYSLSIRNAQSCEG